MTGEMSLRPVIDSDMASLHRLVSGQKSKKKKKSSKAPIRPTKKSFLYSNRFHTSTHSFRPSQNNNSHHQSSYQDNNSTYNFRNSSRPPSKTPYLNLNPFNCSNFNQNLPI